MTTTIFKTKKVNSINIITCEIEEVWENYFSIVIYDIEGGVWIEKFSDTYNNSTIIANKLFNKICKQY